MPFSSSMFGSTNDSQASKKKHDNLSTTSSYGSSKQSKEERFTDAASKSNSGTRDGADDVSSKNPTKLFAFVKKRNWAGAVNRCSGADFAEATKWIVEHNTDGSIRWRLLPIHQVSSLRVIIHQTKLYRINSLNVNSIGRPVKIKLLLK
jgi:hypothetical protein